ncbi:hypothetical protein KFL_000410170 [Klebsormidium nitens]|uniref:Uncharacterized protein n=1 Tax=Klebsormidium nitens TaxID=105231 RepID=A0A1Y1HVP8_KLENI|nr:hypothetical protein KFL_000410170 [Klebsormidium nitens]|eukprot:GAQ79918.1 hypothetical protein KFL_000410170 [Klebsormidium nitens]
MPLSDPSYFLNPKSTSPCNTHARKKQKFCLPASRSSNFLAGESPGLVTSRGCSKAGNARRGAYAQVSSTNRTSSDNRPEEQQEPGLLKQVQISLAEVKPTPAQAIRARKAALGVFFLVGVERGLAAYLKTSGARVSAPVLMLAAIAVAMSTPDAASRHVYNLFEPALGFFDAWLPAFFVPSVVGITIAEIPTGLNFVMVALITVATYLFTLWSSAVLVERITVARGGRLRTAPPPNLSHEQRIEMVRSVAQTATKRFAAQGSKALAGLAMGSKEKDVKKAAMIGARFLDDLASRISNPKRLAPPVLAHALAATVLLGSAAAFARTRGSFAFMAPGLILLTSTIYMQCTRLPKGMKKVLSPTVLSGLLLSGILAVYGSVCLGGWSNGITLYMKGSAKLISMLIGPAVAALGFKVYIQRAILKKSVLQLAGVCLLITPLSLLFTASATRLLGLSPHFGVPLLTETTTLGLALEMAGPTALACSIPLVVENVTACGTVGLNTARSILDSWKVRDPIARGAAVAASSHVLGTSSLMGEEPEAAAVAGLTVAIKGAVTVTLVCIPAFRNMLLRVAGAM